MVFWYINCLFILCLRKRSDQLFYPVLERYVQPLHIPMICPIVYPICDSIFNDMQALTIPLIASFPFLAMLSGAVLFVLINCGSLLKNIFSVSTKANHYFGWQWHVSVMCFCYIKFWQCFTLTLGLLIFLYYLVYYLDCIMRFELENDMSLS